MIIPLIPFYFIGSLTFTFLSVSWWGKLASADHAETFEEGDKTTETDIRLTGRLTTDQSQIGSFSYIATNQYGLASGRCDVGFLIGCRFPLFLNVFNFSSTDFCSLCPEGATCSTNGDHFPYAAKGYWTRTGDNNTSSVYLPCVPVDI
ncbi:hypothetical protein BKA69DRAFT_267899 [Paraphysoderma sedebokerense]|nr:hypothetical protein BKA69DRAFT_267899 [Paraphysoderma sedebokerense]